MFTLSPEVLLIRIVVLLIMVSVHEFAHAYAAYLMGDDTAQRMGRMTLNPFVNIWWPGFILGVLGGFAILGAAPVNPYRMRNPRWGSVVATAAGSFSNLVLAALFAVPFRLGAMVALGGNVVGGLLLEFLFQMVLLNIGVAILSLVPLFPLDGWHITLAVLPPRPAAWWQRYRTESMYVLFGLIILGFIASRMAAYVSWGRYLDILGLVVWEPTLRLFHLLTGL